MDVYTLYTLYTLVYPSVISLTAPVIAILFCAMLNIPAYSFR